MIRELTMSTLAAVMMVSTVALAGPTVEKPKEVLEKERAERIQKVEKSRESDKARVLQVRIMREASFIVGEANKAASDGKCDAICVRSAQSLEKVVREKDSLGLGETIKPEKAVHDLYKKLTVEKKSYDVAMKETIEENNIKQEKLLECAGK